MQIIIYFILPVSRASPLVSYHHSPHPMSKRKCCKDISVDEEACKDVLMYRGYDEEWIKIKVDSVYFETKRDTLLLADSGSLLEAIASGRWTARSSDGAFQFDRDPKLFRYILDYLRNGPLDRKARVMCMVSERIFILPLSYTLWVIRT